MVKGISKRVIVVKAPVSNMFDEAIFILGDKAENLAVGEDELLREARAVADDYVRAHCSPLRTALSSHFLTALISAGATLVLTVIVYMLCK